jgi:hypothetical protein
VKATATRWLLRLGVAAGFFLFFFLRNPFYDLTSLRLEGRIDGRAILNVSWDSGTGFSAYERQDVHVRGEGPFLVRARLPAAPLYALRIEPTAVPSPFALTGVRMSSGSHQREFPVGVTSADGSLRYSGFAFVPRSVRPLLIVLQIGLALVCAWLLEQVCALRRRLGQPGWRSTVRIVLVADGRWLLWTMFACSSAVYLWWLAGQWPGALSADSWDTWSRARTLRLEDWHPYVYVLYTTLLQQFLDSPAIMGLFQLLATAFVGSYVYYYAWRRGAPRWMVLAFFALFALSIPIGLLNVTLWKDVPFSICVILVSFVLFHLQLTKETTAHRARMGRGLVPFLVPLLLYSRLDRREFVRLVAGAVAAFLAVVVLVPRILGFPKVLGSNYGKLKTVMSAMTHPAYYSETLAEDRAVMERLFRRDWEEMRARFRETDNFFELWDTFWTEEGRLGHDPHIHPIPELDRLYARVISQNAPIVIANQTFELLHSVGIDQTVSGRNGFSYYDLSRLWGTTLLPPGDYRNGVVVRRSVPWPAITVAQERIYLASKRFDGLLSPHVLVWNLVVPLAILLAVVVLEGPLSAPGLFALPSLATTAVVFAHGAGAEWRYLYSLHLAGLLIVPLYVPHRHKRRGPPRRSGRDGPVDHGWGLKS